MPEKREREWGHESWRHVDAADRARQFMPFAALRGYYELVHEAAAPREARREMSEERAALLDAQLHAVRKGSVVRAVYYDGSAYAAVEGAVTRLDETFRVLFVIKTRIPFDDLWDIEVVE